MSFGSIENTFMLESIMLCGFSKSVTIRLIDLLLKSYDKNIIFISTFGSLTCMTLAINLARNYLDALLKILNLEYIW